MTLTAPCTCTLGPGPCRICRPSCAWCGDDFFTLVAGVSLCVGCFEYVMDQAPKHAGAW